MRTGDFYKYSRSISVCMAPVSLFETVQILWTIYWTINSRYTYVSTYYTLLFYIFCISLLTCEKHPTFPAVFWDPAYCLSIEASCELCSIPTGCLRFSSSGQFLASYQFLGNWENGLALRPLLRLAQDPYFVTADPYGDLLEGGTLLCCIVTPRLWDDCDRG